MVCNIFYLYSTQLLLTTRKVHMQSPVSNHQAMTLPSTLTEPLIHFPRVKILIGFVFQILHRNHQRNTVTTLRKTRQRIQKLGTVVPILAAQKSPEIVTLRLHRRYHGNRCSWFPKKAGPIQPLKVFARKATPKEIRRTQQLTQTIKRREVRRVVTKRKLISLMTLRMEILLGSLCFLNS